MLLIRQYQTCQCFFSSTMFNVFFAAQEKAELSSETSDGSDFALPLPDSPEKTPKSTKSTSPTKARSWSNLYSS